MNGRSSVGSSSSDNKEPTEAMEDLQLAPLVTSSAGIDFGSPKFDIAYDSLKEAWVDIVRHSSSFKRP